MLKRILALVLALGAAVYLNWQFAPSESIVDPSVSETGSIGDAQYAAASPAVSDADADYGESVETGKKQDGFDEARAERDKTRDEALDTLKDIIDDPSIDDSQKTEAVAMTAKIAGFMEREAAIETLVKAKGYADCVVIVSETQVNVIIPAKDGGLTAADAAVIRDIVIGQINISPSCIKIIEAK